MKGEIEIFRYIGWSSDDGDGGATYYFVCLVSFFFVCALVSGFV